MLQTTFNKDSVLNDVFGGESGNKLVALIIFAVIGFVVSLLVDRIKNNRKIKSNGGFSFDYWIRDNWARMILSVIVIILGILFTPQIFGIQISTWGALVAGFCTDTIVAMLLNLDTKALLTSFLQKRVSDGCENNPLPQPVETPVPDIAQTPEIPPVEIKPSEITAAKRDDA